MSQSLQPISTAAMSALVQELDNGSTALFGDPFSGRTATVPPAPAGKLARVLNRLRRRIVPLVLQSMNTSRITVVWRSRVGDPDDPLAYRYSEAEAQVYAAVSGPTAESLEREWTVAPEYEVLIAASALISPLDASHAIRIDGADYDIVGIQAHPHTPPAVAYRYWLARAG